MEDYHSLYCTPEGRSLVGRFTVNEGSYCQVGHKFRSHFYRPFCHGPVRGISIAEVSVVIEP